MNKFGLSKEQRDWIRKIFSIYLPQVNVYVFGSRARGDHKRYSDLDLALESKDPISELSVKFKNSLWKVTFR